MISKQTVTTYDGSHVHTDTMDLTPCPDTKAQELLLLNLYPDIAYQQIGTFGGAITDAVAATLEKMPEEKSREVMRAYFGPDGIGYRAIRTHIDSCDFSTEQYAAVTDANDRDFHSFSLEHDIAHNIYWIKQAYQAAGADLPVMLSPWSPPAFMKTNGSRTNGGHLKKEYYGAWARYLCRYVEEYIRQGIHVTALSIQNEPNAVQTWDSCLFSPEEERIFLSQYLYPQLCKEGLTEIGLYIWDHNKERLYDRAAEVITDETAPMIAGIAFHWYSGDHFDALRIVREQYPEKKLTFSEGCIEYSRFDQNQLANAQMYGHDIIGNLRAGMNNFFDWNICLDEHGGPNYVGNFCEAPVICDTVHRTVIYKLSFHYIRHFSKYLKPGAKRIATTIYTESIEQVAFLNPDGSIAVVLLNRTDKKLPVILRLKDTLIPSELPPMSISTIEITLN
ncbi:MAG: glycoside hydrolase family 30 beta sandwich domain-containing protein [Faecousia sp.]